MFQPFLRRWLLLLALVAQIARSQGTVVASGPMQATRLNVTGTLMNDGRVLFAGGRSGTGSAAQAQASAEIFDPLTGKFTATGSLSRPTVSSFGVPLRDGRVLIIGDGGLSEIFDPRSGSFSSASLPSRDPNAEPVYFINTTQLGNRSSVWRYNPTTGVLGQVGTFVTDGQPLLMSDGRMVDAGVLDVSLFSVQPDSVTLSSQHPIGSESYFYRNVIELGNGKILISGGSMGVDQPDTNEAYIYDPRRDVLRSTGMLLEPQEYASEVLLSDGRVLLSGAYGNDGYDNDQYPGPEIYDPATGQFSSAGAWQTPLYAKSTLLPDGRVLIVDGSRAASMIYIPQLRAVSAASLVETMAPGSWVSLFGAKLTSITAVADLAALPFSLGGVGVWIRDSSGVETPARLLYLSPTQINFEMPAQIVSGAITITVDNGSDKFSAATTLSPVAPALFTTTRDIPAAFAVRVENNGTTTLLPTTGAIPLDDRAVYLSLYATGVRHRTSLANVYCEIGGITVPVDYAGPDGAGTPGVDQVNLRIPPQLRARGFVELTLFVDGIGSNIVTLEIR